MTSFSFFKILIWYRLCVRPRQGRQVRHRDQRDWGVWRLPVSQVYRLIKDGRDTTDVRGKNKPTNKMQKFWVDASRSVLKLHVNDTSDAQWPDAVTREKKWKQDQSGSNFIEKNVVKIWRNKYYF